MRFPPTPLPDSHARPPKLTGYRSGLAEPRCESSGRCARKRPARITWLSSQEPGQELTKGNPRLHETFGDEEHDDDKEKTRDNEMDLSEGLAEEFLKHDENQASQ